jgi:hypothetical protein
MVMNGIGVLLMSVLLLPLAFAVAAAFAAAPADQLDSAIELTVPTEPAAADHTTALVAQFTAGVRGSRAPPAQSA